MTTASATDVKTHFGEYLDKARMEPVIVQRSGRDVAVLISKEEYDRLVAGPVSRARRPGFARRLFEGVDVDRLLSTPVEGFEEYIPE